MQLRLILGPWRARFGPRFCAGSGLGLCLPTPRGNLGKCPAGTFLATAIARCGEAVKAGEGGRGPWGSPGRCGPEGWPTPRMVPRRAPRRRAPDGEDRCATALR